MPKVYALQRANGQFFTVSSDRVAVWAGIDTLLRCRAHNPELDLFIPVLVEGRIAKRLEPLTGEKGLWLVEPITSNSNLTEGRRIDWPELIKMHSEQKAEPLPTKVARVRATVQELQIM